MVGARIISKLNSNKTIRDAVKAESNLGIEFGIILKGQNNAEYKLKAEMW